MASYATVAEMRAYVEDNPSVQLGDDASVERLLARAERRVDGVLGPYAVNATTGLKLAPASLSTAQKGALSRGCCASAEHELLAGAEALVAADDDFLPAELTVLRRGSRVSQKMIDELGGFGLLKHAGTVTTDEAA